MNSLFGILELSSNAGEATHSFGFGGISSIFTMFAFSWLPAAPVGNCTFLSPAVSVRYPSKQEVRSSPSSKIISLFGTGHPSSKKSILVFGGGSTLGKDVVHQFSDANWRVFTLDFYDASVECGGVNGCALPSDSHVPISLALPAGAPARTQVDIASKCLASSCADKFDIVLNATLGFSPAGLSDPALFESTEYMYRTSVESSLVTARLASSYMAEGGMLVLLGSVAALPGTSAIKLLGFGAAKASVHQMVRLLAGATGIDLPARSSVIAVVPEVLDTPLHRSMNNGESGENWTPCNVIASKLLEWAQNPDQRPPNGALISVATSRDDVAGGSNKISHKFRLIQDSSFVQKASL